MSKTLFYETRAENYLSASKGTGDCWVRGGSCAHVLGVGESKGGGRVIHPAAAADLLRAEGL